MIVIASVLLTPSAVNIGASFLVQVAVLELPNEFIVYSGTYYSGQDFAF
jgi:hypothetical protein